MIYVEKEYLYYNGPLLFTGHAHGEADLLFIAVEDDKYIAIPFDGKPCKCVRKAILESNTVYLVTEQSISILNTVPNEYLPSTGLAIEEEQ